MSSETAITTTGLCKTYRLFHEQARPTTLAEALTRRLSRPRDRRQTEDFWALRDVTFSVRRGEVVGIIGRNGAGKSTLLKILSRITEPSAGEASVWGRVGSLLEVGTGFHPELTGRENIYLNGAILGMRRSEIARRFDEIVAFAEVEKFLDTPVKRYSSGMYVRLAFAVAAHLDTEILLVDEVLAVGDTAFQRKCLGRMSGIAREGRTILFISHNMGAVSRLTERCLLLEAGRIRADGPSESIISAYVAADTEGAPVYRKAGDPTAPAITLVEVETSEGGKVHAFGKPLRIRIGLHTPKPLWGATVSLQICDATGRAATHIWLTDNDQPLCRSAGAEEICCVIPRPRLYLGRYALTVYFSDRPGGSLYERLEGVCPFEISMRGEFREYPWRPGDAVYLEEASWSKSAIAGARSVTPE